jgi:hypothetical protein
MAKIHEETAFFNFLREGKYLGPSLDNNEVNGVKAIINACGEANWPISWTAYALATAYHETAHTMQPIKEYGGPKYFTRMYDITGTRPKLAKDNGNTSPGDGAKYFGRGYVQLTWKNNYAKMEKELKIAGLVKNPDLALTCENAARIMTYGMKEGRFTGHSLEDHLPRDCVATLKQFVEARRIINGTDKAVQIAEYAMHFQDALTRGGWKAV